MGLSVAQVTLSLSLFENIFDIILHNYLYSFSAKTEQEDFRRGQGWAFHPPTDCGIPEEEPFPVVYNFKVMRRFAHPFSLSFSLSSLSSGTLSFPLTSSNFRGVLMPPAADCELSCWLQQSHTSLVADLSHSWFSLPLCPLCELFLLTFCFSPALSKWPSLLPHHLAVPLVSYSHVLCFSIFLSTYFLSFTFWSRSLRLSVYTAAHISKFLGSCILVCFTGSVSVAYLHPLIGGAFSFTRKHTKCSSDWRKSDQEVVSFTEQLGWLFLWIESSSKKEISFIRFQKVRLLLRSLPPACFVRLSKLFNFSEL